MMWDRIKRWRWALIGIVLLLVGLAVAFWPEAAPVDTGKVTRGPMAVGMTDDGVTRAEDYYVVSAPVTGYLSRIELEAGDSVARGTLITTMSGRPSTPLDPRSSSETRSALAAARAAGGELVVDMIAVPDLPRRLAEIDALGVDYLCLHTSKDLQKLRGDRDAVFAQLRRQVTRTGIALAGGIHAGNIAQYARIRPDIIIVGEGITGAADPRTAAQAIRQAMDAAASEVPGAAAAAAAAPVTLHAIAEELSAALGRIATEQEEELVRAILQAPRIFVAGAGRSGLMARAFAMRLMHMGLTVYAVGDVTTPALAAGDLLLIASGSGRTTGLVNMAEKAASLGATVATVTMDPQAPIAALADAVLQIHAPTPKAAQAGRDDSEITPVQPMSVQPMGSLFEQCLLLCLDHIIVLLMERKGQNSERMFQRHANLE